MKEMNISDELLSRFLEGTTDEDEETRLLQALEAEDLSLADLAAIEEAAKLADKKPLVNPDPTKAEKQICASLNSNTPQSPIIFRNKRKSRMRVVMAMAASLALVVAVALFVLFRPDSKDPKVVKNDTDSTAVISTQPKAEKNLAQSAPQQKNTTYPQEVNAEDNETAEPKEVTHTSQTLEKQYARTQTTNSLTVTKPGKDNYRVLCKNLEKTLNFEWTATNAQTLHFVVKDSDGKTIAETKEAASNRYVLKYSDIYPEKRLNWSLTAIFKDGTQDKRGGQIQIDYQLN